MKPFRRLGKVLSEHEQDLGRDGLESDSQKILLRRLPSEVLSGRLAQQHGGRKFDLLVVVQRSSSGQGEVLKLPEPL